MDTLHSGGDLLLTRQSRLDGQPDCQQALRHHDGAVDLLAERVVVLDRHVDRGEKLQVDLLHRAQVLDPHGDPVHHRLQLLPLGRIRRFRQLVFNLLPQQLSDVSALLHPKLRLSHLLIKLFKFSVVLQ